jgi:hypothetical protein
VLILWIKIGDPVKMVIHDGESIDHHSEALRKMKMRGYSQVPVFVIFPGL